MTQQIAVVAPLCRGAARGARRQSAVATTGSLFTRPPLSRFCSLGIKVTREVKENRRGEAERIDPIHHSAVAR